MDRFQCRISQQCQVRLRLQRENRTIDRDVCPCSGVASLALVNTYGAAAAALLTWTVIDAVRGQVSVSGSCIGPIIGLVSITPAAGFVEPGWAIFFGVFPTIIIYFILVKKHHMRFDDTLDVAIVHGGGKSSTRRGRRRDSTMFFFQVESSEHS